MAKTARSMAGVVMAVGMFLWAYPASAAIEDAHVRSASVAINAAIEHAIERSATFGQMVQTIQESDSIVFLTEGDCGHNQHACFTTVTAAGSSRIMWVIIDLRHAAAESDLMRSIGHELRHTIEVISERSVRNDAAKFYLYSRIGFHAKGGGFETMAATDAGNAVRDEVRNFERHATSS